jgi:hypothetical protein
MKNVIKEAFSPFMDKCVIRLWEIILLTIAAMAGAMGFSMALLYYGNDISKKFGWQEMIFSNVDDSNKLTALIMGGAGCVLWAVTMTIITSKGRTAK